MGARTLRLDRSNVRSHTRVVGSAEGAVERTRRAAQVAGLPELREIAGRVAPVALAGDQLLPVPDDVAALLPRRGLRRGSVVAVGGASGATTLALRLVASASAAGSWVGLVGLADAGVVAAAELGIDLARLAVVPDAGPQWATVTAALLDALDLVIVRPPGQVRGADARRLAARARERGAVLLVVRGTTDAADVRLEVSASRWQGLGEGHGVLGRRVIDVVAGGRGAAARPRRVAVELDRTDGRPRP